MSIESFIDSYLSNYTPYKASWNYEDGCIYKGAMDLYRVTQQEKYLAFILDQLEGFVTAEGGIINYRPEEFNIDNINAGKVLFDIYTLTGQVKYRQAIERLKGQLDKHPRTQEKNFWHKKIYPNQVWLDGLYMAMPFYAKYEKVFNRGIYIEDICHQFLNVRKRVWDAKKQLYYHGYDESRKEAWCDPNTGLSKNFWGRAMGWYAMALVDTLEIIADEEAYCKALKEMLVEALEGLLRYREEKSGLWYQVIDAGPREGNYLETSASLMIAYTLMKAVRLGYIPEAMKAYGLKAFEGVINTYLDSDNKHLGGICGVAGLGNTPYRDGSYEYYISEKITINDPKGVGALMMAYSEYLY